MEIGKKVRYSGRPEKNNERTVGQLRELPEGQPIPQKLNGMGQGNIFGVLSPQNFFLSLVGNSPRSKKGRRLSRLWLDDRIKGQPLPQIKLWIRGGQSTPNALRQQKSHLTKSGFRIQSFIFIVFWCLRKTSKRKNEVLFIPICSGGVRTQSVSDISLLTE